MDRNLPPRPDWAVNPTPTRPSTGVQLKHGINAPNGVDAAKQGRVFTFGSVNDQPTSSSSEVRATNPALTIYQAYQAREKQRLQRPPPAPPPTTTTETSTVKPKVDVVNLFRGGSASGANTFNEPLYPQHQQHQQHQQHGEPLADMPSQQLSPYYNPYMPPYGTDAYMAGNAQVPQSWMQMSMDRCPSPPSPSELPSGCSLSPPLRLNTNASVFVPMKRSPKIVIKDPSRPEVKLTALPLLPDRHREGWRRRPVSIRLESEEGRMKRLQQEALLKAKAEEEKIKNETAETATVEEEKELEVGAEEWLRVEADVKGKVEEERLKDEEDERWRKTEDADDARPDIEAAKETGVEQMKKLAVEKMGETPSASADDCESSPEELQRENVVWPSVVEPSTINQAERNSSKSGQERSSPRLKTMIIQSPFVQSFPENENDPNCSELGRKQVSFQDATGLVQEFCRESNLNVQDYHLNARDYCVTIIACLEIYGALAVLVFINALVHNVGRGRRHLDSFGELIEQWLAWDDVQCLSQHHVIRKTLWKFYEEYCPRMTLPRGQLTKALQFDMSRMQSKAEKILNERLNRRQFISRSLEDPTPVINLLQTLLDMPELTDTLRRSLARSIAHLARKTGCYPDCLLLDSVEKCGASAIAGGGFADIWQGNMGSVPVALKALRIFKKKPQERALKNFSHEAVVWRQLKHRNILPFLGVFKGSEHFERLCLVSPWMEAGNITEFLDSRPDSDRITLLSDIAEGLNYLHHSTPSVAHGDLKGANIFITPALTACLGDFGLSRFRDFIESTLGSTTGNGTGTVRWQAPELLHNDNDGALVYASQESDMYSFGCVCIEVMTDEPPFAELKRDGAVVLAVSKGQKPQRPTGDCVSRGLNDSLWELMMRCWDDEPNRRPTTEYAVGYFNGCKRNESRRDKISYEYSHVPASLCQYGFPDEHIPNLSCATTSIDDGSIIVP